MARGRRGLLGTIILALAACGACSTMETRTNRTCARTADTGLCNNCMLAKCCVEATACEDNPHCGSIFQCTVQSGEPGGAAVCVGGGPIEDWINCMIRQCAEGAQDGVGAFSAETRCEYEKCYVECGLTYQPRPEGGA